MKREVLDEVVPESIFAQFSQKRQVILGIPNQHDRPWRLRFATFGEILPGWSAVLAIFGQQ
jgi:hypothetical protein